MSARKSRQQIRNEVVGEYEAQIANLRAVIKELSDYRQSADQLISNLRERNEDLERQVRNAPKPFMKIQAIKRVRKALGIGIREAKEFVEAVADDTVSVSNGSDTPNVRIMTISERKARLLAGLQGQPSPSSNYTLLKEAFLREADGSVCERRFAALVELIDASRKS